MQRNILLLLLFFVVLASGVIISNKFASVNKASEQNLFNASSSAAIRVPNQYKNETYGFSLEYPFNLQLKESSPSTVTIGVINDLETNADVEIRVAELTVKPAATESGEIAYAKRLCKSTLQNQEISCPKAINESSEISTAGSTLNTFYLEEVTTNKNNGEVEQTIMKGPFISTSLNKTKNKETIVLIYPPLDKSPGMVNAQLIRDISSSLKKVPVATSSGTPIKY